MTFIILRLAFHLPEGALLNSLDIRYVSGDSNNAHVAVDMRGDVFKQDPDEEIEAVNLMLVLVAEASNPRLVPRNNTVAPAV